MMNTSIALDKLEQWFKSAKPGDAAFNFNDYRELYYVYVYREDDTFPCWSLFRDIVGVQKYLDKYLEEIMESKMNKRCDKCKHFKNIPGSFSWCSHKDHAGALVPVFTTCADHEPKQKSEAPFDNLKFFIKDQKTGELEIKYICEDCGKIMERPFHWQFRVPFGPNKDPDKRPGYYYWCEECWEKEKKK